MPGFVPRREDGMFWMCESGRLLRNILCQGWLLHFCAFKVGSAINLGQFVAGSQKVLLSFVLIVRAPMLNRCWNVAVRLFVHTA